MTNESLLRAEEGVSSEDNLVDRVGEDTRASALIKVPSSHVKFNDQEAEGTKRDTSELTFAPEASVRASSSLRSRRTAGGGLRSGVRINKCDRTQVEEKDNETNDDGLTVHSKGKTQVKHLVKIFTTDSDFVEVSPAQLARVKAMHTRMEEGASFSFNYNTLLVVASVLAGLALVSNSATTVIASMLVSPIMGPVVGIAYGSTIRDWKLVRKSVRTELISLLVCIIIGMVIAAVTGPTRLADEWPTQEMYSRGTSQTFYVALPIAFFSGLGVAVSLLDEQTSSLVGVAISASLLPPAVNSGILWVAYAFVNANALYDSCCDLFPNSTACGFNVTAAERIIANASSVSSNETGRVLLSWFDDVEFNEEHYSCLNLFHNNHDEALSYYRMGIVSLMLTLANIVLIWLSGMLMFRMKEVLPIEKKVFWEDLGVARRVYTNRAMLSAQNYTGKDESESENEAEETIPPPDQQDVKTEAEESPPPSQHQQVE